MKFIKWFLGIASAVGVLATIVMFYKEVSVYGFADAATMIGFYVRYTLRNPVILALIILIAIPPVIILSVRGGDIGGAHMQSIFTRLVLVFLLLILLSIVLVPVEVWRLAADMRREMEYSRSLPIIQIEQLHDNTEINKAGAIDVGRLGNAISITCWDTSGTNFHDHDVYQIVYGTRDPEDAYAEVLRVQNTNITANVEEKIREVLARHLTNDMARLNPKPTTEEPKVIDFNSTATDGFMQDLKREFSIEITKKDVERWNTFKDVVAFVMEAIKKRSRRNLDFETWAVSREYLGLKW